MRNRVALFVTCILLCITCQAQFQLPESEVNALSDMIEAWPALRTSVEGPWGDPKNDDPCNSFWDGLECRQGHVTVLSPNVTLAGTIPESIGNLTYLKIIRLSGREVSGTIPSSVEELQNLIVVDLSSNKMTGSIPNFRNSSYLTDLILSNNGFSGPIPDYTLPLLENLLLANNSFSGSLPLFDLLFPEIVSIDVSENHLSGSLSSGLNSLRFIERFDLSSNRLGGIIPAFGGNAIVSLRLSHNQLTGTFPNSLKNLNLLTELHLDHNLLSGPIDSPAVGDWVESVHLESNSFSGPVPEWSLSVRELNLAENQFSICSNPRTVTVPNCNFSGQKIRSCGCNAKSFYNFCILDPIPTSCRARVPVPVIVLLSLALVALLILLIVMIKKRTANASGTPPPEDFALSTVGTASEVALGAEIQDQSERGEDSDSEGENDSARIEW